MQRAEGEIAGSCWVGGRGIIPLKAMCEDPLIAIKLPTQRVPRRGTAPNAVMSGPPAPRSSAWRRCVPRRRRGTSWCRRRSPCRPRHTVITGPQMRGTGGTLIVVRKGHRDRGHPPKAGRLFVALTARLKSCPDSKRCPEAL